MFFLSLVPGDEWYFEHIWTPARLFSWFNYRLPIKVNAFELACLFLLLGSSKKSKSTLARPVVVAIRFSLASVAFCILNGLARGGLTKPIYTQVHMLVLGMVFALTCATVLSTAEDFRRLENAIVYAAIWQAVTVFLVYLAFRGQELPQTLTTHEDSVTFVVGLLTLISQAIELRTKTAMRRLIYLAPIILVAIQLNNRRLAWASLMGGLLVIYFLLPAKGKVTRKLNRALLVLLPVIVIYVGAGWGRKEPIFKPVASISSMFSAKATGELDRSTKARDNENRSLVTMIPYNPLLGTGLGQRWVDLDPTYAVPESIFPMYYYSPHNSLLALLAFCGGLGCAGLWMVFPVSVYLNARTYRRSTNRVERTVAVIGIIEVVAYLNQCYGDMGVAFMTPATIMGAGVAAAARLSVYGARSISSQDRMQRESVKSTAA